MKDAITYSVFIGFILFISFVSCSKWPDKDTTVVDGLFSIPGKWTCTNNTDTTGQNGYCISQKDTLVYRFSDQGVVDNISPLVAFDMAFRSYHYEKFFDFIFFDKKLRRLYRDSVMVKNITPQDGKTKGLFPCKDCNSLAFLRFKTTDYIFPFKLDSLIFQKQSLYTFSEKKTDTHFSSILTPKVGGVLPVCQFAGIHHNYILQINLTSKRSEEKTKSLLEGIHCLYRTH